MDKERQKEVKRRFGARLSQLRKAKKLSQEAVALASGQSIPEQRLERRRTAH